mmetsp:Transcript_26893/g.72975  ORF Transcript_26893/g.72975 Transcript_26893/m.72975 type:complete len:250 (-) Transcript_26893:190-939(-)
MYSHVGNACVMAPASAQPRRDRQTAERQPQDGEPDHGTDAGSHGRNPRARRVKLQARAGCCACGGRAKRGADDGSVEGVVLWLWRSRKRRRRCCAGTDCGEAQHIHAHHRSSKCLVDPRHSEGLVDASCVVAEVDSLQGVHDGRPRPACWEGDAVPDHDGAPGRYLEAPKPPPRDAHGRDAHEAWRNCDQCGEAARNGGLHHRGAHKLIRPVNRHTHHALNRIWQARCRRGCRWRGRRGCRCGRGCRCA